MPTRLEPFGIAFLEAMMHRLPVVATRIGAIPEIVQDGLTGELVVPGDTDALAKALLGFLGNPARCQRAGEAGYRRATQIYTWEHVAERIRARILPMIGVVDRRGKADLPSAPHRRRAAAG
jgi:glycosyltransferase involved in cell wall biosynthesis